MTEKEAILVKHYVKSAYPNMKDDATADLIWYDMLQEYEYLGILESVKKFIRSGNKFPPSLAEIISGYQLILNSFNEDIIRRMDQDGVFNDYKESEMSDWNRTNRMRRTRFYLYEAEEWQIPTWFKELLEKYQRVIKNKFLGGNKNENSLIENQQIRL